MYGLLLYRGKYLWMVDELRSAEKRKDGIHNTGSILDKKAEQEIEQSEENLRQAQMNLRQTQFILTGLVAFILGTVFTYFFLV